MCFDVPVQPTSQSSDPRSGRFGTEPPQTNHPRQRARSPLPLFKGEDSGVISRMDGKEELERLEPPTHQARAFRKSWLAGRLGASEPVLQSAGRGVNAVIRAEGAFIKELSVAAMTGATELSTTTVSAPIEPSAASSAAAAAARACATFCIATSLRSFQPLRPRRMYSGLMSSMSQTLSKEKTQCLSSRLIHSSASR